jgi:nitrogen fixation protein NifB
MVAVSIPTVMSSHPCFSDEAHDRVGRVHLPVAPKCNIQCNFCERRMCATTARPGCAARLLSPEEAAALVDSIVGDGGTHNFVAGIAGPGDPLANDATFRTLALLQESHPSVLRCLCTNGLLLEDRLGDLQDVGIGALTVTVSAPDPVVASHIYAWARYDGRLYRGMEAAELLVEKQFRGLKAALTAGISLKVNSVLIPGVNDGALVDLARRLALMGVPIMNIMPLIPSGSMRALPAPTCEELRQIRQACAAFVRQFCRCEQCRADIIYLPDAVSVL